MTRFWLALLTVTVVSTACGPTQAAGPPHRSRTAGVYIALIEKLRMSVPGPPFYVDATATSSAGSQEIKPSGERPISASVQREVHRATGVRFISDRGAVIVHHNHVRGNGSVITLGLVPPTGDHIVVGAGAWYGNVGGKALNYKLSGHGGDWHVVGDTGIVGMA